MSVNQTVKDRLIVFIKSINIGQGAFEKRTSLSNGYVNNIRVSIQPDKLQKIALQFPQLNTGWLITGEGNMLKIDDDKPSASPENQLTIDRLLSIIESQQRTIETLTSK